MLKKKTIKRSAEAEELRGRAAKMREEILDPKVEFTMDELKKKTDAIAVLEQRAAVAAEFTQTAEIAAQGGDVAAGLQRLDAASTLGRAAAEGDEDPEEAEELAKLEIETRSQNMLFDERVKDLQARSAKAFGTVKRFLVEQSKYQAGGEVHPIRRRILDECRELGASLEGRTVMGGSGNAADVLLPLQQVPNIFSLPNVLQGILQGAARYAVTGRTIRIPFLSQTDATKTRPMAGIANVGIIGEGGQKPVREPKYDQRILTCYKIAAIAQIGDETMGDDFTGQLAPSITNQVGGQVLNYLNELCTWSGRGDTTYSEPLAALAIPSLSAATLQVSRTTHLSITVTDIFKMYSRHTHGPKSMWLCSRRVIEKLFALTLAGTTLVAFLNNLQSTPAMSLLGYPIYICDILPSLGNVGDLNLVNPEFYAAALRTNLTVESSIHVAFTQDVTTYRFLARGGGIPIPDGTYAYQSPSGTKVDEHSPFTQLYTATGS